MRLWFDGFGLAAKTHKGAKAPLCVVKADYLAAICKVTVSE